MRARRSSARLAALVVAGLALASCGGVRRATTTAVHRATAVAAATAPAHSPVTPSGQKLGRLSTPGTPKGEQTVPIQVVATPGSAKRSTMALVPVYIDGHGPFAFALDTGASRSLLAAAIAQQLHLPDRGSAGTLYGIGGGRSAQNVAVARWRAGTITLPAEVAAVGGGQSGAHPPAGPPAQQAVPGPVGLLGSDVLSRYGKIAVDYDKGLLILDPPVR